MSILSRLVPSLKQTIRLGKSGVLMRFSSQNQSADHGYNVVPQAFSISGSLVTRYPC
jgi:hypothetical protein